MTRERPQTVAQLRQDGIVTNDEIAVAVERYLKDPKTLPFTFASGHVLDVAVAVQAYRLAREAMLLREAPEVYRRTIVRTVVILATPEAQ